MHTIWILLGVLIVAVAPAAAEPLPPVNVVVDKMKEAFEPLRPSVRTMTLKTSDMGETEKFVVGQIRKQLPAGRYMATVVLSPVDVRGSAFLVTEFKDPKRPREVWIWLPVIRRLKKLFPIDAYNHFLGTDFTYADLGFMRQHKNYQLLGVEEHAGVKAYKINEKFPPSSYYYSHVVMWVAQQTMLPLERDYYEPGGTHWKTEVFDSVATIDGVPTVMHAKMTDLMDNTSTGLTITQIKYDVPISDALLDPQRLPSLPDDPIWQTVGVHREGQAAGPE
jgi:hypothetical protein